MTLDTCRLDEEKGRSEGGDVLSFVDAGRVHIGRYQVEVEGFERWEGVIPELHCNALDRIIVRCRLVLEFICNISCKSMKFFQLGQVRRFQIIQRPHVAQCPDILLVVPTHQ